MSPSRTVPFFDVLRTLEGAIPERLNPVCGALRPYLPELAGQLPPDPDPSLDPQAAAHRLFRAVRALLAAVSPVAVVVEDLHRADDGTRDLLRFLTDDPPPGLATVLSYRREDLRSGPLPLGRAYRHPPGVTSVVLPLRPLDVAGVRTLTAAPTGRDVPAAVADRLHERTAGIPFVLGFVLEEPGELDGFQGAVPLLMRDAMAERVAGLSEKAAAAVRAAAVLQVPAAEELIGAVAGRRGDEAADALREALRAGVLHDCGDDRYGFRHGLAHRRSSRLLRRVVSSETSAELPDAVRGEIRLNLGLLLNNRAGRHEQGRGLLLRLLRRPAAPLRRLTAVRTEHREPPRARKSPGPAAARRGDRHAPGRSSGGGFHDASASGPARALAVTSWSRGNGPVIRSSVEIATAAQPPPSRAPDPSLEHRDGLTW
ncbi:AAA family ATPase [Streptomyces sp. rh34]|uniref:AAA family ATPase n=1 Tax=Streptomyces sp. rh34 TaxID=2034272 RepID=UPI0015CF0F39|nr:AAA family ATPase [Streptomyces sp. rh34]